MVVCLIGFDCLHFSVLTDERNSYSERYKSESRRELVRQTPKGWIYRKGHWFAPGVGAAGGGGKKQGLELRNDVLATCKAIR